MTTNKKKKKERAKETIGEPVSNSLLPGPVGIAIYNAKFSNSISHLINVHRFNLISCWGQLHTIFIACAFNAIKLMFVWHFKVIYSNKAEHLEVLNGMKFMKLWPGRRGGMLSGRRWTVSDCGGSSTLMRILNYIHLTVKHKRTKCLIRSTDRPKPEVGGVHVQHNHS